jgi:hypothetical protein
MGSASYADIEEILQRAESRDTCAHLCTRLNQAKLSSRDQLGLLQQAFRASKHDYFHLLVSWEETADLKKIFDLLKCLFNEESYKRDSDSDERIEYLRIAERVLLVTDELLELSTEDDYFVDAQDQTFLHLVAQHGTPEMADVLMEKIRQFGEGTVLHMLQHIGENLITPLGIALRENRDEMAKFLIQEENKIIEKRRKLGEKSDPTLFKRVDNVSDAAAKGNLSHLRMLLENHDWETLLSEETLNGVARNGMLNTWEFIVEWNPNLSKSHKILLTAIKTRHREIMRRILQSHPALLKNNLEATRLAASDAKSLADKAEKAAKVEVQGNRKLAHGIQEAKAGMERVELASKGQGKKIFRERDASDQKKMPTIEERRRDTKSDPGRIRDLLLEYMVRQLTPREVQSCWPRARGMSQAWY